MFLKKPTYLLPEDYDYLMSSMQSLIAGGKLIEDRTVLSPENYGFDIYSVDLDNMIDWKFAEFIQKEGLV